MFGEHQSRTGARGQYGSLGSLPERSLLHSFSMGAVPWKLLTDSFLDHPGGLSNDYLLG